jgi:5-methylcytosine-specific restriction endonuclease McrA
MQKPIVVCLNCGESFKARASKRSDTGRQKFCSFQCKITYALISKPRVKCECCGKEFSVYPSQLKFGNPRFCSLKCANSFDYRRHNKEVERTTTTCETCGKKFTHRATEPRRYCSGECANNIRKSMSERFRRVTNPTWRAIRKSIIKRDGYKCARCGKEKILTVHHIVRWVISRDDSPSNLITLCRSCHWLVEWCGATCPTPPQ